MRMVNNNSNTAAVPCMAAVFGNSSASFLTLSQLPLKFLLQEVEKAFPP